MISPLKNVPFAQLSTVKGLIDYLKQLAARDIILMLKVPFPKRLYGSDRYHFVAVANPEHELSWTEDKLDWLYYMDMCTGERVSVGSLTSFYLSAIVRAWIPNMVPPAYRPDNPETYRYPTYGGPPNAKFGETYILPRDENYFGGELVEQGTKVTFAGYRTQTSLGNQKYERQALARYPDGSYRFLSREATLFVHPQGEGDVLGTVVDRASATNVGTSG